MQCARGRGNSSKARDVVNRNSPDRALFASHTDIRAYGKDEDQRGTVQGNITPVAREVIDCSDKRFVLQKPAEKVTAEPTMRRQLAPPIAALPFSFSRKLGSKLMQSPPSPAGPGCSSSFNLQERFACEFHWYRWHIGDVSPFYSFLRPGVCTL